MPDDLSERVAVLESKEEALLARLDRMDETLNAINRQLTRFHGAMGAIAFLVTGVGVAWEMFGDAIKRHWQ